MNIRRTTAALAATAMMLAAPVAHAQPTPTPSPSPSPSPSPLPSPSPSPSPSLSVTFDPPSPQPPGTKVVIHAKIVNRTGTIELREGGQLLTSGENEIRFEWFPTPGRHQLDIGARWPCLPPGTGCVSGIGREWIYDVVPPTPTPTPSPAPVVATPPPWLADFLRQILASCGRGNRR